MVARRAHKFPALVEARIYPEVAGSKPVFANQNNFLNFFGFHLRSSYA